MLRRPCQSEVMPPLPALELDSESLLPDVALLRRQQALERVSAHAFLRALNHAMIKGAGAQLDDFALPAGIRVGPLSEHEAARAKYFSWHRRDGSTQEGPKTAQEGPKTAQDAPKTAHVSLEAAPRRAQDGDHGPTIPAFPPENGIAPECHNRSPGSPRPPPPPPFLQYTVQDAV